MSVKVNRKKVVLVIANRGYQPREYGIPRTILENANVHVVTASDIAGVAEAKDGSTTTVDLTLQEIFPDQYNGIFLVGGSGAMEHLDNELLYNLLQLCQSHRIPYGAICISPRILAKAGVLTGHKATGWNEDHKLPEIFAAHSVTYVPKDVVVDGIIVTAQGPAAAELFGKAILQVLNAPCEQCFFDDKTV